MKLRKRADFIRRTCTQKLAYAELALFSLFSSLGTSSLCSQEASSGTAQRLYADLISVNMAKNDLYSATVLEWAQPRKYLPSEVSPLIDAETSEVPKYCTNDPSSVQLILSLPVRFGPWIFAESEHWHIGIEEKVGQFLYMIWEKWWFGVQKEKDLWWCRSILGYFKFM